jgi:regulator of sigma E protease
MIQSLFHGGSGFLESVLAFLLLITPVVFFHELGHFSIARLFGVKVETFSIGFGPAIASWVDRKGTLWKLSWFPLGGYVKFLGDLDAASTPDREKIDNMSAEERAGAFPYKPLYQRALIVAAGPVANFILAIAIFTGFLLIFGGMLERPVINQVVHGSVAEASGFKVGDLITQVDGRDVDSFDDVAAMIQMRPKVPMNFVVQRRSATIVIHATPKLVVFKDRLGEMETIGQLGFVVVAGKPVTYGPIGALKEACHQTWSILRTTWDFRMQLMSGTPGAVSQLHGPLGIATIAGKVASISFLSLIKLAALISVSIGLVNLFPIPMLDGGHLLYYGCEAVLGRPLGARAQELGFRLGLAVILGLMVLATWNDLVRLNLF